MKRYLIPLFLLAAVSTSSACASSGVTLATVNKDLAALKCGQSVIAPLPACLTPEQYTRLSADVDTVSSALATDTLNRTPSTLANAFTALATLLSDALKTTTVDLTAFIKDVKAVVSRL